MTDAPASGPATFSVSVPGSTSNLGPGFDTLGMAITRRLEVQLLLRGTGAPEVHRGGLLAPLEVSAEDDLVVRSLIRDAPDLADRGVELRMTSSIPVGMGLGTSAAARVAGSVLARLATGRPVERAEVLEECAAVEGHPDNVAPAVWGGLVASGPGADGHIDVRRLPVAESIGWGWAAPDTPLSTDEARAALPDSWPRAAVVRTLSRLARLIPALADPGPDGRELRGLMEDELHVPSRIVRIPGGLEAMKAAQDAGAWGVTISGAGSGLLVAGDPDDIPAITAAMLRAFMMSGGQAGHGFPVKVDQAGARWSGSKSSPD